MTDREPVPVVAGHAVSVTVGPVAAGRAAPPPAVIGKSPSDAAMMAFALRPDRDAPGLARRLLRRPKGDVDGVTDGDARILLRSGIERHPKGMPLVSAVSAVSARAALCDHDPEHSDPVEHLLALAGLSRERIRHPGARRPCREERSAVRTASFPLSS